MPRAISIGSALVALVFLVLVLADATLVDRRLPSVTEVRLSATAGGDRIAEPISSINVVFSEAVRTATAEPRFHIVPDVLGALSWDGPTLIFTPSEPMPAATDFVVTVDAGYVDLAGNVATTGIDEWTFATAGPPRVLVATPQDGAVGLAVDSTVELEFDRLMDTTSVEAAITVQPPAAFTATWSGTRVSLAFDRDLGFGTAYSIEVGAGATDTAGAHLESPFVLRFSTVSAGLAARVVPADDVAGISVRSPIAILFDGPIEPASALEALSITPEVGGAIEVVGDPNGGPASVLLFRPSSPLAENTTYSVTLAPVVHRLASPDLVAAGHTWSFTTGSETESAQNQIAFLSERSGVRNVWLINPDGSNARQLTVELTDVIAFDFTGDGRRLAYASGGSVATMNVDGSDPRRLTEDADTESAPRLTPDESHILLSRRGAAGEDLGWWLVPTPWTFGDERQILASGATAEGPTMPFTPPYQPAFDPRGSLALVPVDNGRLMLVDLAADIPTVLADTDIVIGAAPLWSDAAGAFLAPGFTDLEGGNAGVFRIEPGGERELVAGTEDAVEGFAVDEDGRLLYAGGSIGGPHLVLFDVSRDDRVQLTDETFYDERAATFSPDGRRAVFARVLYSDHNRSEGLWLIDLASRDLDQLTIDGTDPHWLP